MLSIRTEGGFNINMRKLALVPLWFSVKQDAVLTTYESKHWFRNSVSNTHFGCVQQSKMFQRQSIIFMCSKSQWMFVDDDGAWAFLGAEKTSNQEDTHTHVWNSNPLTGLLVVFQLYMMVKRLPQLRLRHLVLQPSARSSRFPCLIYPANQKKHMALYLPPQCPAKVQWMQQGMFYWWSEVFT